LMDLPLVEMAEKVPLHIRDIRRLGEDWRITATPR